MPSTAGATIGMPPARVENEANLQLQEEYTRWEAASPGSVEKIPMFSADFPGFTLKIVEHSRNLLTDADTANEDRTDTSRPGRPAWYLQAGCGGVGGWQQVSQGRPSQSFHCAVYAAAGLLRRARGR